MKSALLLAAGALLLAACDDAPTNAATTEQVVVMSRNIYLGGDVAPVLAASAQNLPVELAAMWRTVQDTDFAERAVALADEIAAAKPHLVGLQEVSLWRIQSPGDFLAGNPQAATEVEIDFLAVLLAALEARGLAYSAVSVAEGADVELPMLREVTPAGPAFDDLRYTDRDVILARNDVPVGEAASGNFAAKLVTGPISVSRAWASVRATIAGRPVRFVNVHLETSDLAAIQLAQGDELLERFADDPLPVILVGDLNSAADGSTTATYATVLAAGYADAWARAHPGTDGFTCCEAADLLNSPSSHDMRIDFVFLGEGFDTIGARIRESLQVERVGNQPADRTPSGLWPSDHAGLVATFELPRL